MLRLEPEKEQDNDIKRLPPMSFFVDAKDQSLVKALESKFQAVLSDKFGGSFRVAKVTEGHIQIGEEPQKHMPLSHVAFRMVCPMCMYVSIYFYVREGLENVLPLALWTPCEIPTRRLFPASWKNFEGGQVPVARDFPWLKQAQRRPLPWIPEKGDVPGPCYKKSMRSVSELANTLEIKPLFLYEAFDLSSAVQMGLGLYDLMRLREDSEEEGLHLFSDKIRFKGALQANGIPIPKIYHMCNDCADLLQVLKSLGTTKFVAKPTHLAATSYVFVMRDGINLINGKATSIDEVAAGLTEAFEDRHVDDWATEHTPPGIIIEELINAPDTRDGIGSTPDEMKCITFFGELFFCEWVYVENMTTPEEGVGVFISAQGTGDRAQPGKGHAAFGIPNFASKGYIYRDKTCLTCKDRLPLSMDAWVRLVNIVEEIATGTDHIRIDVFITPEGEPKVNEANISFLKISKFPDFLVEEMRRRWLEGYRRLLT